MPAPLPLRTRAGMRLRHGFRIGRDVQRYAREAGLWWLVPAMTVIAIASVAITTTTTALPVAVYALL